MSGPRWELQKGGRKVERGGREGRSDGGIRVRKRPGRGLGREGDKEGKWEEGGREGGTAENDHSESRDLQLPGEKDFT